MLGSTGSPHGTLDAGRAPDITVCLKSFHTDGKINIFPSTIFFPRGPTDSRTRFATRLLSRSKEGRLDEEETLMCQPP